MEGAFRCLRSAGKRTGMGVYVDDACSKLVFYNTYSEVVETRVKGEHHSWKGRSEASAARASVASNRLN